MREILDDVERWQAEGKRVALATVITVTGSAPRGVGAVLAASEAGDIAGSVSGGCVEPAVIEEGMRAIRTGRPKLLQFGITEEQNVERIGLSCGGEIRVFVQRLPDVAPLAAELRAERPVAIATLVSAPSANAAQPGAQLLVREGQPPAGSLGTSALDAAAVTAARELLREDAPTLRALPLSEADPEAAADVFFAVYPAPPALIIVGAGHISIPLSRIAKVLGYRVTVLDPREAFNTEERLPDADERLLEWPDEALPRLPLSSATAVAVLTHDEKFDVPALAAVLQHPVGYVGAIGSRGTRERRDRRLREVGVTDEQIARIHGPIGLDIGARTPEEIALAIMAQIVAVRNGSQPAVETATDISRMSSGGPLAVKSASAD